MSGNQYKMRNGLWLARKRLGLQQKQVAYLLKQKNNNHISRYEQGVRMPSLKMLLQLEIVYGVPPRVLFREYYEYLQGEIATRAQASASLHSRLQLSVEEVEQLAYFCPHLELLKNPTLSEPEKARIREHVMQIMRKLGYQD